MDRHPDTARSSESERRVGARTEASFAATSFDNVAGKGLKSVFFFFKERLFPPPLDLAPSESKNLSSSSKTSPARKPEKS